MGNSSILLTFPFKKSVKSLRTRDMNHLRTSVVFCFYALTALEFFTRLKSNYICLWLKWTVSPHFLIIGIQVKCFIIFMVVQCRYRGSLYYDIPIQE